MAEMKYTVQNYTIENILGFIRAGVIAIPEIQRPFVWPATKVRDLIDSLYNNYPVGYIITWQNPKVRLKNGELSADKKTLIDGQQRVTALMAAIVGEKVVDENYNKVNIKISYNPFPEPGTPRFEVQNKAILNNNKWIKDISELFAPDFDSFTFVTEFSKSSGYNPVELNKELTTFKNIVNSQIGVIELRPDLDIDTVTEIFVRINSKGSVLDQSDFVMSKISANSEYGGQDLRKTIDYFCHLMAKPEFLSHIEETDAEYMKGAGTKIKWAAEFNKPIFVPTYSDILRTAFMYSERKGRMADLVSLLSGRNFETKQYEEAISERTFNNMTAAVGDYVSKYNFNEFVVAIQSTGFAYEKLVTSMMTVDFAYALYLILSKTNTVPKNKIAAYIGRWFVMSVLTGRYTGSPESQFSRDLRMIEEKGFIKVLEEIEASDLSDAFWSNTLVGNLESRSTTSPAYLAYLAAQIFNQEVSLFTESVKVDYLVCNSAGDVHHLFPRDYLKKKGLSQTMYNQVANYAYIGKKTNISISNMSPKEYFAIIDQQCKDEDPKLGDIIDSEKLSENMATNCVPEMIKTATFEDYPRFLEERRALMANKIKEYYQKLIARC